MMPMPRDPLEKNIRRLLRAAAGQDRPRWSCPSDSEIAAFFDRMVTAPQRRQIEAHLERCSFCRDQVASLARATEPPLPELVPSEWLARARALQHPSPISSSRRLWPWAPAAAVVFVVLVGVVVFWRSRPFSPSVPLREPSSAPFVRGAGSLSPAPALISPIAGSLVSRQAAEFRWTPVEGATEYQIIVLTAAGDIVWQSNTAATTATLPSAIHLTPGSRYFVRIRASLREGKWVQSKAVPFSVAASP